MKATACEHKGKEAISGVSAGRTERDAARGELRVQRAGLHGDEHDAHADHGQHRQLAQVALRHHIAVAHLRPAAACC